MQAAQHRLQVIHAPWYSTVYNNTQLYKYIVIFIAELWCF